jgi:hypothetical protein
MHIKKIYIKIMQVVEEEEDHKLYHNNYNN